MAGRGIEQRNYMKNPLVSVNLVVWNGEKYIENCLAAVRAQTYAPFEVVVFDNHSTDRTREIVKTKFPEYRLVENRKNIGLGPGWNRCLDLTEGKYVLGLCVDVVLDKHFIAHAVETMERHPDVGAVQAKVYQLDGGRPTEIIDTTGFLIFKSRRIVNRGHGERDAGQFSEEGEVFSYEGAAPFWRRRALEESKVNGELLDEDFFWYADDIDLGWRMRLFGWKSYFAPRVIAWHDRQTTKRTSAGWIDFIKHRKTVPAFKRRLDWQNLHFTFLKNDLFASALKDSRYFLWREGLLLGYLAVFEPFVFKSLSNMVKLLPRMIVKRMFIMSHRKTSRKEMEKWFL